MPWLMWLSWLGVVPQGKKLLVWSLVRAYAWVVGLVAGRGVCEKPSIHVPLSHGYFSPFLYPSLSLSPEIRSFKKDRWSKQKLHKHYQMTVQIFSQENLSFPLPPLFACLNSAHPLWLKFFSPIHNPAKLWEGSIFLFSLSLSTPVCCNFHLQWIHKHCNVDYYYPFEEYEIKVNSTGFAVS